MTPQNLVQVLTQSFVESRGRAGETPLDELVRQMHSDPKTRAQVEDLLFDVVKELKTVDQWRGLEILIGQAPLNSQALGEAIDAIVSSNALDLGGDTVWPIRCVVELGASLSDETLRILDRDDIRTRAPLERFLLIAKVSEARYVAKAFEEIPKKVDLNSKQATSLVRAFRREASRLKIEFNGHLSAFLDALSSQTRQQVAAGLRDSIGSTYDVSPAVERRPGVTTADASYHTLMRGMQRVTEKIQWSLDHAQNGYRTAA